MTRALALPGGSAVAVLALGPRPPAVPVEKREREERERLDEERLRVGAVHVEPQPRRRAGRGERGGRRHGARRGEHDIVELIQLVRAAGRKGEMQRVSIGRALVRRPSVYLMDEPLSSLDAKLRADLRVELKKIQADFGATLIYVTHDQVEAMTMADRMIVNKDLAKATLVVRYEDLVADPAKQLASLFDHVELNDAGPLIDRVAPTIHAPDYYRPKFDDAEIALIRDITKIAAKRFGYE